MTDLLPYDSEAFNLSEYNRHIPKNAIRKDLLSYLGEYRFGISESKYKLYYSDGHIRDADRNEPMIYMANRALKKRILHHKPTHREEAEYEGITRLDRYLQDAQVGDVVIWGSPPGPKDENYGDYGFVYGGVVIRSDADEKDINMTAFRIERSDTESYKQIISDTVGSPVYLQNADDFLAHPLVIRREARTLESVLLERFGSHRENDRKFRFSMQILEPLIKEFIDVVKLGLPREELKNIFYSIENLALQIKEDVLPMDYTSLIQALHTDSEGLIAQFGSYRAPFAKGSCGGTDEKKTNILDPDNFIKKLLGENEDSDQYGNREFDCPVCHHIHRRDKGKIMEFCPDTTDENGLHVPIPKC